jgi:hypothetical protein
MNLRAKAGNLKAVYRRPKGLLHPLGLKKCGHLILNCRTAEMLPTSYVAWEELPDAVWQRMLCRDPSALPHFPMVVRLTVGMTRGTVD